MKELEKFSTHPAYETMYGLFSGPGPGCDKTLFQRKITGLSM